MAVTRNGNKKTALIYCRTATAGHQAPTEALNEQAEECTRCAESLGYTIGRVTREIASGSGACMWRRPLFARDWADLEAGKFQVLIVTSLDRLARDSSKVAGIAQACERLGVELVSVTGTPATLGGIRL